MAYFDYQIIVFSRDVHLFKKIKPQIFTLTMNKYLYILSIVKNTRQCFQMDIVTDIYHHTFYPIHCNVYIIHER